MPNTDNPFKPPNTSIDIEANADEFAKIKMFTAKSRIGRLRYTLFSFLLLIVIIFYNLILRDLLILGIGSGFVNNLPTYYKYGIIIFISVIPYLVLLLAGIFLVIQRCHDLDTTGWLSLLILIPFAPVLLCFTSGTKGVNKYGPPPPPNTKLIIIGSYITVALLIFLIWFGSTITVEDLRSFADKLQSYN